MRLWVQRAMSAVATAQSANTAHMGTTVPLCRAPTLLEASAARMNCRLPISAEALPALAPCPARAQAEALGTMPPSRAMAQNSGIISTGSALGWKAPTSSSTSPAAA